MIYCLYFSWLFPSIIYILFFVMIMLLIWIRIQRNAMLILLTKHTYTGCSICSKHFAIWLRTTWDLLNQDDCLCCHWCVNSRRSSWVLPNVAWRNSEVCSRCWGTWKWGSCSRILEIYRLGRLPNPPLWTALDHPPTSYNRVRILSAQYTVLCRRARKGETDNWKCVVRRL